MARPAANGKSPLPRKALSAKSEDMNPKAWASIALLSLFLATPVRAADPPKKILLLGTRPDTHPAGSHEYMAGVRLTERLLKRFPALQVRVIQADPPWTEGPDLLANADGVFLYMTEGARWLSEDPARLKAFQGLAARGGGLVALHWGMGTKSAEPVAPFVQLFGACHGGPDRKIKVTEAEVKIADDKHPVTRGLGGFRTPDEWYYGLKKIAPPRKIESLLVATLDGKSETVAWAYRRPDGGRSCGFTSLHYHENWKNENYRRFVVQAILWSVKQEIPAGGAPVDLPADAYQLSK
jgi:hypothetical protein